jgi:hypothetical protein
MGYDLQTSWILKISGSLLFITLSNRINIFIQCLNPYNAVLFDIRINIFPCLKEIRA